MRRQSMAGLATLAVAAGLSLAACSSSPAKSADAASTTSAGSSSKCGTIPASLPADPNGVLTALPASLRALYNGYPVTVYKSAFASWKPKSNSKTVGFLLSETNNGYQLALQHILEGMLHAAGYTVDAVTSSDQVTDQVADFNQMVERKDAVIVYEPLSSSASPLR